MIQNSFVHRLSRVVVEVMFYGGILCCLTLPWAMPLLGELMNYGVEILRPLTFMLLLLGLCALYILWQLKAMFRTLVGGDPFVAANVSSLRKCALASFIIAGIFFVKEILWFNLLTATYIIIFALLGLFCLTLKDLFKQAVAYKEENDWTV